MSPTAIGEWYAQVAIQYLPYQFSNFTPSETTQGAYYFCIRHAVKGITERGSVETFPSPSAENTVAMGDGRYRVETYLFEDRASGDRIQQHFVCVVKYDSGTWILEDLTVARWAQLY